MRDSNFYIGPEKVENRKLKDRATEPVNSPFLAKPRQKKISKL